MRKYATVREDTLSLYISEAVSRATENWNMFQDGDLLATFRDEIVDDVISELDENGYLYE